MAMNISPEEAQATLDNFRQTTTKAHGISHFWAYYTLLWGIIWCAGFLASQWQPQFTGWIWGTMVVIGMIGSAILGATQGGRMRPAPGSRTAMINTQPGIFNGVLYGFAILWLIIFTLTPHQIAMLWVTVVMFSTIIAGAWMRIPLSIGLGAGVTVMSVLGYYLLPSYFYLWEAVFAGLPLVAISVYYLWRR
ncbi:MAG TPA: hypothetical protein VKV40_00990 [Ktedonobacteraceae bacterium]|nr:hypothetical protein [Ktedonobacteraceae bacterium]